jgi:hypothetical protein
MLRALISAGIAAAVATPCGAAPAPPATRLFEEVANMPTDTVYKGRSIHLSAKRESGGAWTGTASFADSPGRIVETGASFPTEGEALSAALSEAMAVVDRARMFRGKP